LSYAETLRSLEELLESFLQRALAAKETRLSVLDGIDQLDDIARQDGDAAEFPDRMGQWFAEHRRWLGEDSLRPTDMSRIGGILSEVRSRLDQLPDSPPTRAKICQEIDRWTGRLEPGGQPRLVLKRGPEESGPQPTAESIVRFDRLLKRLGAVYADLSGGKEHVLSVLDEALKAAQTQKNKEALLLSAYIIYSLKLDGYLVDPYVKRLKQAERLLNEERHGVDAG
jgi:hypothetical protein